MSETQIDIQAILDELKLIIGEQAQQIALLKAAIKQAQQDAEQGDKVE